MELLPKNVDGVYISQDNVSCYNNEPPNFSSLIQ